MLLEEAESLLFWSRGKSIFRHDTHTVATKAGWKGKKHQHLLRERERTSSNPNFELWIADSGDQNMAQIFLFLAPSVEEHPQSVDVRPDGGWLKGMFHTSSASLFPWPVCLEYYFHLSLMFTWDWEYIVFNDGVKGFFHSYIVCPWKTDLVHKLVYWYTNIPYIKWIVMVPNSHYYISKHMRVCWIGLLRHALIHWVPPSWISWVLTCTLSAKWLYNCIIPGGTHVQLQWTSEMKVTIP